MHGVDVHPATLTAVEGATAWGGIKFIKSSGTFNMFLLKDCV